MKLILFAIGAVVLHATIQAAVLTLAWNLAVPGVFAVGQISLWQAFGFLLVAKILFQPEVNTQKQ